MKRIQTVRVSSDDSLFFFEERVGEGSDLAVVLRRLHAKLDMLKDSKPLAKAKIGVSVDALIHNVDHVGDVLKLCLMTLGKDEMARYGSRWRRRSADDPDKLRRVILEMRLLQKEGKAVRNPGSYAEDLWKRFV